MKNILKFTLIMALAAGTTAFARERLNRIRPTEAKKLLTKSETGEKPHTYCRRDKFQYKDNVEVGDTFFHLVEQTLRGKDQDGYRYLIFDNDGNYLGYYETFEEYRKFDGPVFIFGEDGRIEMTKDGPPKKVSLGSMIVKFMEAPEKEVETTKPEVVDPSIIVPEYRDYTLTVQGKTLTVRAIFVKFEDKQIYLKLEVNGKTRAFPTSAFSPDDQKYLQPLIKQQQNKK